MNDFQGLLSGEYGFKTQGKSAPMAPPRSNHGAASSASDFSIGGPTTVKAAPYSKTSVPKGFVHDDHVFRRSNSERNRRPNVSGNVGGLDGVSRGGFESMDGSSVKFDSVSGGTVDSGLKFSSLPFDKPVYDDEVFDGVSGLKSSSSAKYEDIFTSSTSSSNRHDAFDDLLGDLGRKKPEFKSFGGVGREHEKNSSALDHLFPGFGPSGTSSDRPDRGRAEKLTGDETRKGRSSDPMEQCSSLNSPGTKKPAGSDSACGAYDGMDPLDYPGESLHVNGKEEGGRMVKPKAKDRPSFIRSAEQRPEKKMPGENFEQYSRYDTSSAADSSLCKNGRSGPTLYRYTSSANEGNGNLSGDVWLTVSEIPLLTQPTAAPPPSRPPPPRPPRISKTGAGSAPLAYAKEKVDDQSSFPSSARHFQSPKSVPIGVQQNFASPVGELEDFATGRNWSMYDEGSDVLPGEDMKTNTDAAASAAAMKEAVDRAEARFRHAKEVREKENVKAARMQREKREETTADLHEGEFRERMERQRQERQLREEEERKKGKEEERLHREEGEKEQRIIERERIERARGRQAVERATREARGRAAADAHSRAEKAAVGKVQAEARERAEKAAVLRAQAEARERAARAAAGAKQRADKENAERAARDKAEREAKEKEARDMAAAASTRAYQQKNENDLESFFNMGRRASSNPRPSASSSDPFFDSQSNNQAGTARSSVGSAANTRKASLPTSFYDDLNSILGGSSTPWEFREVEGETEERRKARLARQQRTQERADKAVAEKNQRDLDAQREQAERHRISETLDVEIKRWAAGKEGNLRALLSTLQYVLWPECGWQPVSLTDLIPAAAVKKVYRKATLCIHPDKVQQKGATLQQKYIAEKVFDILKESWNKFNSEELF